MRRLYDNIFREINSFNSILFICLFSSSYVFFKSPFEFYFHYLFIISLVPFFILKYGFPKIVIQLFSVPLFVGLFHVLLGGCDSFTFVKVLGGLVLTFLFYYYIFMEYKFDVNKTFSLYIKFSYWISVVGVLQIISYLIGFKQGYDFSWIFNKWGLVEGGLIGFRVNSILSEPAQLAIVLSPAVYVSVRNLLHKKNFILSKNQSLIVVLITILTSSSIGFFGLLIAVLLNTQSFRFRYLIFGVFIFYISFSLTYKYVGDFKSRFDSAIGLWINQDFSLKNTNNSSFVLYNNLHIAKENLLKHPLFGTGLGSHETAFNKYTLTGKVIQYDFAFNKKDGNSLLIRLCTETGILGVFFVVFFTFKCFIWRTDYSDLVKYKIISQGIFVLIILSLIRQGNYMLNGLPLLFLLYYYNYVSYNRKLISLNNSEDEQ